MRFPTVHGGRPAFLGGYKFENSGARMLESFGFLFEKGGASSLGSAFYCHHYI